MKNHVLANGIKYWSYVAPLVSPPKNDKELELLASRLDDLLDIIGDNEKHPLMSLADIISDLIAAYEEKHHPVSMAKGIDALKFLMDSHQLNQADLPEIGSQGVVSEILNGKRTLNMRQIKSLAERFHVEPSVFID